MFKHKLLILTCADGFFGHSLKVWDSMDVGKISSLFSQHGYNVSVHSYEYVAKHIMDFQNYIVVYSSTQKPGYKDFLEDVLLGLQDLSNQLIPRFDFFRAHENKGYQEILRQIYGIDDVRGRYYSGSHDAFADEIRFPAVYKPTSGSRSIGVSLVYNKGQIEKKVKKNEQLSLYWKIHSLLKKIQTRNFKQLKWYSYITPRHRFVVQEFIYGLSHDYKVLVFGEKYFVLKRTVRDGDFRASGSGKLKFVEADEYLLNYAQETFKQFKCPFISMDICKTEKGFGLIEFQGVHFGPYTLINSPFHYINKNNSWQKVDKAVKLECEYVKSICSYINDRF